MLFYPESNTFVKQNNGFSSSQLLLIFCSIFRFGRRQFFHVLPGSRHNKSFHYNRGVGGWRASSAALLGNWLVSQPPPMSWMSATAARKRSCLSSAPTPDC